MPGSSDHQHGPPRGNVAATTQRDRIITTAIERAPTRGRPSAGPRDRNRQKRRLNRLNFKENQVLGTLISGGDRRDGEMLPCAASAL